MELILVVVGSYLLGALPSAYVVGRMRGVDIFSVGSGNMGATNVARALGTHWGLLVAVIDVLKGLVAVWVTGRVSGEAVQVLAALYVVFGHNWSLLVAIFTKKLRGGKGAATTFGVLLGFAPPLLLLLLVLLAAVLLLLTRWSSLAMLVCFAVGGLAILYLVVSGELLEYWLFFPIINLPITFHRYRGNIQRLVAGTERRVGERI